MDAKNSPHDSSSSSADGHDQLIPGLPTRESRVPPSPSSNTSNSSPVGDENPPWPAPPAPEPTRQDAGRNATSRARKPRKANNGKSPLFWVHMDQQSVSEGAREDTLKRIRSHVMSEHNRKKRLESTKRYKTKAWKHLAFQPVETTTTAPGQAGPARVGLSENQHSASAEEDDEHPTDAVDFPASSATAMSSESHDVALANTRPESMSPWAYLGAGGNDPFGMTHTPLSDRMLRHLQHFLCDLTQIAYPFHLRCGPKLQDHWASLVRHDPASLHACICVASSNSALQAGQFPLMGSKNLLSSDLAVDTFHHRGETIKLVNKGLSDPSKAASDELIAAVSMLLTIEIASGNPDYLKIHLAGLRQMVALRKSFADVQPDIRFQISWTDIRVASMALTKPIFPSIRYPRPSQLSITPPNENLLSAASRLLLLTEVPGVFGGAMSRTICDLLELVWYTERVRDSSRGKDFGEETEEYFNTEVLYVEYSLHTDRYNDYGEEKGDASIEGCVRLACLLFHNTMIWDFYPQIAPVIPKPIIALRVALQATIGTGLFSQCHDLLIWLLFIGACSSGILSERLFFIQELAAAVRIHRVETWQQLRGTLMPFFYVDRCYLGTLHAVWNELQMVPVRV